MGSVRLEDEEFRNLHGKKQKQTAVLSSGGKAMAACWGKLDVVEEEEVVVQMVAKK